MAKASEAARALARKQVVTLRTEALVHSAGHIRAPHMLNPHQLTAYETLREANRNTPRESP